VCDHLIEVDFPSCEMREFEEPDHSCIDILAKLTPYGRCAMAI